MTEKKVERVLFLSSWFPNRVTPLNGDFVERHAIAVSRVCKTAALHVCPDPFLKNRIMEIYEVQKDDLFEVIIYIRRMNSRFRKAEQLFNNLLYFIAYVTGYFVVKKEIGRPDIIHANVIQPVSRIAYVLHRLTGIPYIISEHWTGYLKQEASQIDANYKHALDGAFAIVPVTSNLRDRLRTMGYNYRYYVVPNVVDTSLFKPGTGELKPARRLLHVSSMKEDHKNISGILKCIHQLRERRDDFIFTFAGDATEQQRSLAHELKLSDFVEFTGEVSNAKVASMMQNSDALIMFSNFENLPCVVLEALSCGIPVISSRVGGIDEVLDERFGILIDPGDEDSLTGAMDQLLNHLHEYDRNRLHEYAENNFSMGVIASKFLDIYNQAVINNKK